MRQEPRTRRREDESEDDVEGPGASAARQGMGFELARVIEAANAAEVVRLLGSRVRARDGVSLGDEGVELADLEPAEGAAGYRDAATHTLSRALGVERSARLLIDLLVRASHRRSLEPATRTLAQHYAGDEALIRAMEVVARARAPEVLPALGEIAPDVVRMSASELKLLARAGDDAIEAALPRLALGVPALAGKHRRAAEGLLHAIAPLHTAHAPAALAALLRAGALVDRRQDGIAAIERAAATGALENVRVFENAGARLRTDSAPQRPKANDERRREAAGSALRGTQRTAPRTPTRAPAVHPRAVAKRKAEAAAAGSAWDAPVTSARAMRMIALLVVLGGAFAALLLWQPRIVLGVVVGALALLGFMARGGRSLRWFKRFRR